MDWGELAFQAAMTVALTSWVKHLANDKLGQWSVAVAMGIAFVIVFLAMATDGGFVVLEWVKQSLYVGVGAAGFYKGADKIGGG